VICAVIVNLALTSQPVLVEELFKTLTVNEPSASVSPVTNQGSILDLLFVKVLDLAKLEYDLFKIFVLELKVFFFSNIFIF
jgi:hypothetical protein